jgi:hypothetical protein
VQELYLAGDKAGAMAALPDSLIDQVSLIGPRGRVRDRLEALRESGVTQVLVGTTDVATLRTLAELAL